MELLGKSSNITETPREKREGMGGWEEVWSTDSLHEEKKQEVHTQEDRHENSPTLEKKLTFLSSS